MRAVEMLVALVRELAVILIGYMQGTSAHPREIARLRQRVEDTIREARCSLPSPTPRD
jgi:hypothetical protein